MENSSSDCTAKKPAEKSSGACYFGSAALEIELACLYGSYTSSLIDKISNGVPKKVRVRAKNSNGAWFSTTIIRAPFQQKYVYVSTKKVMVRATKETSSLARL